MYNKLIEVESQALFPFTFFPKQFAAEGSQCFLSASTLSGMLCSPPWAGLQACLRSCLPFRFPAGLGCCVSGLLVFHPGCCVCLASCVPACLPPCLPASKAKTENEFQSAISATVWGLQFFFGPVQICYKAGGRKHWEPMRGQSIEALGICTENPKDRKETDH